MKEILQQHGLIRRHATIPATRQDIIRLSAAERRTEPTGPGRAFAYPTAFGTKSYYERRQTVRRVRDLINFSQSPLPSRAIRLIRNGISSLEYNIRPKDPKTARGKETAYAEATKVIKSVLNKPSVEEDFQSFWGQMVEDSCIFDAMTWEYVDKPRFVNGNEILALEVIPGYTIAKNSKWKGDPKQPRWIQLLDDGRVTAELLDRDIEYVMYRKRSFDPFGLSPLETAIEIMESWLGVSSFQRQVASDAYPSELIYLGDDASEEQVLTFRAYWRNELVGRGMPGMMGGTGRPDIIPLKPKDDGGLYLMYEEKLTRILAVCFDLHPMDFGLERDVNRNTSETQAIATSQEAIMPLAQMIASRINSRVIPRISEETNNKTILELEFYWVNLNPRDAEQQARVDSSYANLESVTVDELREAQGREPYQNDLGKLSITAFRNVVATDPTIMLAPKGTNIREMLNPQVNEEDLLPLMEPEEEEEEIPIEEEEEEEDIAAAISKLNAAITKLEEGTKTPEKPVQVHVDLSDLKAAVQELRHSISTMVVPPPQIVMVPREKPEPVPAKKTVIKNVQRDAHGQITQITEEESEE